MTSSYYRKIRIDKLRRVAIFVRDDYKCVFCNRGVSTKLPVSDPKLATIDHLCPRHDDDSTNEQDNLVTCCRSCNQQKGSTDWETFIIDNYGLLLNQVYARIAESRSREITKWNSFPGLKRYIKFWKKKKGIQDGN